MMSPLMLMTIITQSLPQHTNKLVLIQTPTLPIDFKSVFTAKHY